MVLNVGNDSFFGRLMFIVLIAVSILALLVLYNKLFRTHSNYLSNGVDVLIIDNTLYRNSESPVYVITNGQYSLEIINTTGGVVKNYTGENQGAFNLYLDETFPLGVYSVRYGSSTGTTYNMATKLQEKDFFSGFWDWFIMMGEKSRVYLFGNKAGASN